MGQYLHASLMCCYRWENMMDLVIYLHLGMVLMRFEILLILTTTPILHCGSGMKCFQHQFGEEVELTTKKRYESYEGDILNYMAVLDLSSNELTGDTPSEIGKLKTSVH